MKVRGARVLVMGLTFKENCPDLRNTRVIDIVRELAGYEIAVDVHDPWVDLDEAEAEYGVRPIAHPDKGAYDGVIVAVAHGAFHAMGLDAIKALGKPGVVVQDLKAMFPKDETDFRL